MKTYLVVNDPLAPSGSQWVVVQITDGAAFATLYARTSSQGVANVIKAALDAAAA